MMIAVDLHFRDIQQPMQRCVFPQNYGVYGNIIGRLLMMLGIRFMLKRNILVQAAAQYCVDKLNAPAYSKDRLVLFDSNFKEKLLHLVTLSAR